jgi:polyribonucleotide 5'-hydroxyl-kinase
VPYPPSLQAPYPSLFLLRLSTMATGGASKPTNTCQLAPGQEFRLEVPPGETASLTLVSGSAEVFGAEMVANRAYTFGSTQQAVFSWGGCSLEVQGGEGGHSYVASETPMMEYLKLHTMLDQRRTAARASGGEGPRVLICGPSDTGKSSLCRILANYLARSGHEGTIVDFDLEHGEHLVPGAVCAVPIARPLDIEGSTEDLAPLAYWLGHASSSDHVPHLKHLVSSLSRGVRQRHEANEAARAGGMVLNTSGWVEGAGCAPCPATRLRMNGVLPCYHASAVPTPRLAMPAAPPHRQPLRGTQRHTPCHRLAGSIS